MLSTKSENGLGKYHSLSHQITPDTTIYNILPYCDLFVWVTLLTNVIRGFSGTSLLIIVVVTMDFMAQMQALMMSKQYEGLLQKANLRGYGKSGQLK